MKVVENPQSTRFRELPAWQTHLRAGRVAHPNSGGRPSQTSPFVSLLAHPCPLSYPLLHNKLVNLSQWFPGFRDTAIDIWGEGGGVSWDWALDLKANTRQLVPESFHGQTHRPGARGGVSERVKETQCILPFRLLPLNTSCLPPEIWKQHTEGHRLSPGSVVNWRTFPLKKKKKLQKLALSRWHHQGLDSSRVCNCYIRSTRPSSHCGEVQITPQPDEFVGPTSRGAPVGSGNSNELETHPAAGEGGGERPGVALMKPSGLHFFFFNLFYWSIVDLQSCINFCCTANDSVIRMCVCVWACSVVSNSLWPHGL